MHPYDPNQPPYQPPPVFVQQPKNTAATVGIWVLVAWIVGPTLLIALCCVGCFALGGLSAITGGATPDPSATASP